MQYKIIVDKQSRTNPSSEKREYIIDIEELRVKGDVYDSLVITEDEDYVMRRLSLSDLHVLSVLDEPVKEALADVNIELFDGDNYIYLVDMIGNKFYAEYLVKNDFTDTYATKIEMNTAITQTAQEIMSQVNKKVDGEEFGTLIEQNWEHIKYAWNQISQYLQLEGIEGKASLVIYDENNQKLIVYDDSGQHFYDGSDNIFGEMGVKTVDNQKYIAFSVKGEYSKTISDGMAWGMTTESDGKFWPILFIKNFSMASQNAGNFSGQLVLNYCDLLLGTGGILSGNVKMKVDDIANGIYFEDTTTGNILLSIYPDSDFGTATINILNNIITFFTNELGSKSLKIGTGSNACVLTDEGYFSCADIYASNNISAVNYVSGKAFQNTSLLEFKKNIERYDKSAIEQIKNTDIYAFNYKDEEDAVKKTIGAIISDEYNCSDEIISDNKKAINTYSMTSIAWKAIQEQQELIEQLQESDKQKDELITDLIKRLERLEAQNGKN